MKKYFVALSLVLMLAAVPAFACATPTSPDDVITQTNTQTVTGGTATATGGAGGAGGSVGPISNTNTNQNVLGNTNTNTFDPRNTNTNTNLNTNLNTLSNKQDQYQSQTSINVNENKNISKSSANSFAAAVNAGNNQSINEAQQFLGAPQVIPMPIPLIQGGRVGDVTSQVVKFAIAALPYNGERVITVLKIVKGSIFKRTRLEDIEIDLLDAYKSLTSNGNGVDPKKIRYLVQYKDSAMGSGINIGGAGSVSGIGGGSSPIAGAGSGAIGFGYTRSTADPAYFIKFYQVE